MKAFLDYFLGEEGFQKISSNLPEFTIYFKVENNLVNVIHAVDYRSGFSLTNGQYEHIKKKVYELFQGRGLDNIHILSLFISHDMQKAKLVYNSDKFSWIVDPTDNKLVIYETQVEDFYGIKVKLEDALFNRSCIEEQIIERARQEKEEKQERRSLRSVLPSWSMVKGSSYVNIGIVIINVAVFLICTFTGNLLYNIGALYGPLVVEHGEIYRFLTAMFLHGDINHLASNMIILYFLGELVEKEIGHIRYFILYLLSGLGGGLLSVWYDSISGKTIGSIGASGAIFGMIGALFVLVILHRGRLQTVTFGKVLFLIIYSLYSGFSGTNTDNAAHVGGLLTGFLLTAAGSLLTGIYRKIFTGEKSI